MSSLTKSMAAGLGFGAAALLFGVKAFLGDQKHRNAKKHCGGGKRLGHGHGHGHCHKKGACGTAAGSAAAAAEEEQISAADEKSAAAEMKTAIDIGSADGVTQEAIKKDTESALAMMHAELKPLSDEFVAWVKEKYAFPESALARLSKLFDYNLTGGKCFRGVFVINTTRYLCQSRGLSWSARRKKAIVLAWCIEILQACFLVADDIMDGSITRRGKPCWYKLKEVGLDGVNDSLILESFIYFLINKYFPRPAIRLTLLDIYHEVALQTQLGQMLDLTSNPQGQWNPELLNTFTLDVYKRIVRYKTAYYSFYLPVASAMVLCGTTGARELSTVQDICVAIGEKFQIQDDWLDCFGDPTKIGKIGTDIADHKCSWLLVQALLRCNAAQRALIEQHYGRHEDEHQQVIKKLYGELAIGTTVYEAQEKESYDAIDKAIRAADAEKIIPRAILHSLLVLIHKRQK